MVSLLALLLLVSLIVFNGGYQSRMPPILQNLAQDVSNPRVCSDKTLHCPAGKVKNGRDIFLLGDSHLRMLEKSMLSFADDSGLKYNGLNSTACLYLPGLRYVQGSTGKVYFGCDESLQDLREDVLMQSKEPIVVIGGRFSYYLSGAGFDNREGGVENQAEFFYQADGKLLSDRNVINKTFSDSFEVGVNKLLESGATIVLVYPIPEVGWHVPRLISAKLAGKDFFEVEAMLSDDPITTSYERYVERSEPTFKLLDSLRGDKIVRVYPHRLFCNTVVQGRCVTHSSSKVFYLDDDHLSEVGAEMLVGEIARAINRVAK
jgi:hypothetical protein